MRIKLIFRGKHECLLQITRFYKLALHTNNYILRIQRAAALNNLLFLFIVLFECHPVDSTVLEKKIVCCNYQRELLSLLFPQIQMRRSCQFLFFPSLPLTVSNSSRTWTVCLRFVCHSAWTVNKDPGSVSLLFLAVLWFLTLS